MTRRMCMALISLLGIFLGAYLTLYKFGIIGSLVCNVGSCERVQTSRWSVFLGLPVATWGVGFYLLMLALSIVSLQERFADSRTLSLTIMVLAGWGVLFTAWLNYLEGFVIHAWCEWCLGSATIVLILFVLALIDWREHDSTDIDIDDDATPA
jgi:uncharacterized membrane protein